MDVWITCFGVILALLFLAIRYAAEIYDLIALHMTTKWYRAVLSRLDKKSNIIDVGIGTASSLIDNLDIIQSKQLTIVGIDYNSTYITKATANIKQHNCEKYIRVYCKSIYDTDDIANTLEKDGYSEPFNVAYFSGSFSLLPDPIGALNACANLLGCKNDKSKSINKNSIKNNEKRIYITQTFQKKDENNFKLRVCNLILYYIKPLLKFLTTIDFGELKYHSDLDKILSKADMQVIHNKPIVGSIDNMFQTARLIILNPLRTTDGNIRTVSL